MTNSSFLLLFISRLTEIYKEVFVMKRWWLFYFLGFWTIILHKIAYNIFMINRLILILSLIVFAIILAILFLTSPAIIGPVGILFFFVMVYFLSFGAVTFFMHFFVRIFFSRKNMIKKDYIKSGIIAILPITVLMLIASGVRNPVILVAGPLFLVSLNVFLFSKINET